jgi:hypothetical protein
MNDPLQAAFDEALAIGRERGWTVPDVETLGEAQRLLALVEGETDWDELRVEPDGVISIEWEVPERGWLQLSVRGQGTLTHSAVIDGDEYEQTEPFGPALPGWAQALLVKLRPKGH